MVPVICIGNRGVSGGERATGVLVLDVQSIAKRLAAEPAVLSASEVQEFATLLDQALPPFERRIVHEYLRERGDVETHSEGNEPERYLVITPRAE